MGRKKKETALNPLFMMEYNAYMTDITYANASYIHQEYLFREFEKDEKTNSDSTKDPTGFREKLKKYDKEWARRFLTERVAVNYIKEIEVHEHESGNWKEFIFYIEKLDTMPRYVIKYERLIGTEVEHICKYMCVLDVKILDLSYTIEK